MAGGERATADILSSYKSLAEDSSNHNVIIQDKAMIQFIAYCLDSTEPEVVRIALDTTELLVENRVNHSHMKSTFGVLEALNALSQRNSIDKELCKRSAAMVARLTEDSPAFNTRSRSGDQYKTMQRKSSRVYSFHVFGLNEETRSKVEDAAVRVRGVISLVVDTSHQRCTIRAIEKVTPEMIAKSIADYANLESHLVVRNKLNQEVLKVILHVNDFRKKRHSLEGDNISNEDEEDESLPPYLPEEESPVGTKALYTFDRFKTSAASWMKSATSLFQNSFYW